MGSSMHRFVKVRGRSDLLVANPHALGHNPGRYAGQRHVARGADEAADAMGLVDHYEPVDEVMPLDEHIRTAIAKDELAKVDECVARDLAKAVEMMAKKSGLKAVA
jgi:hypothetical protein